MGADHPSDIQTMETVKAWPNPEQTEYKIYCLPIHSVALPHALKILDGCGLIGCMDFNGIPLHVWFGYCVLKGVGDAIT